jgi:enamine deaminase RidA (YjgF/YER057c/UK114 family)
VTRTLISSGSLFEVDYGYSRAVVQGDWCFVAGTTGYNYVDMSIAEDVVAQCEQTFQNIDIALRKAGFTMADVVRVTGLIDDLMKIEIEVTAFRG